jgi:hypothetical protein
VIVRRTLSLLVGALVLALGVVTAVPDRTSAVTATTVVTADWEWQILTGESALFGMVTPPVNPDAGSLGVLASSPALTAPELPIPTNLFALNRWVFNVIDVLQPVANGPVSVYATASGSGGIASVAVVIDGGSLEYTVTLPDNLTGLIAIDYDPIADGYADGEIVVETVGSAQTEISGWLSGSATHHSFAWALDQLPGDPNQNWVTFVSSTSVSGAGEFAPTLAPVATGDGLFRALIFSDGPVAPQSAADTWVARLSLQGGVGCASDSAELADVALTLRTASAAGSLAASDGCLEVAPITGTVGEPLDITVPISLDPALSTVAWRVFTGAEKLVTGPLPDGLDVELVRDGSQLLLRVVGTPTTSKTSNVGLVIGADSASAGVDLIDAVRGTATFVVNSALAPTGPLPTAPLGLAAALLLVMGILVLTHPARTRSV